MKITYHPLHAIDILLRKLSRMKEFLFSVLLLLASFAGVAQQQDSSKISTKAERKFYVGAGVSSVSYMLMYANHDVSGENIGGSIEPVVTVHAGYRLSPRINVQVGIGYNRDEEKHKTEYYAQEDDTQLTYREFSLVAKGLIVPLTVRFTPFKLQRRLQLYASASIVPALGSVKLHSIQRHEDSTMVLADAHESGLNVFFIGGLHLKYRLSNRFDVYAEGNLLYRNITNQGLYDLSRPKSLGIGINYKL